ncbi:DUF4164 family protein [Methylopila sp. M107]|uniref:DUF4164 family protein n=1 Tax=Methylopila sp. M107 TaxID=1101190 RepID=UPI00036337E3|nr:DUF4164 family protein [Methylopila sp. M107]
MGDLDQALHRLNAALEAAEAAVGRAIDGADAASEREAELQAFADDRTRLAELLDGSAAKAETARRAELKIRDEVASRVDAAIAAVESVLAEAG